MTRDWTPAERATLSQLPKTWPRQHTLTLEQVREIRERTDSLTVAWTLNGLAAEYGVSYRTIGRIARRQRWPERAHEPGGREYWKAKELREIEEARLDRQRRREADEAARLAHRERA